MYSRFAFGPTSVFAHTHATLSSRQHTFVLLPGTMSAKQRPPRCQPRVRFCLGCLAEVNVKRRRAFPFLSYDRGTLQGAPATTSSMEFERVIADDRCSHGLATTCCSTSVSLALRVFVRHPPVGACSVSSERVFWRRVGVCTPRIKCWASSLRWQPEVSVLVRFLFASACLTDLLSDSLSASLWDLPTQIGEWESPSFQCTSVYLY